MIEGNHYDTLQVASGASREEIRASFRRLVKVYHPDKNPTRVPWAEVRMRDLLAAYRVVSDSRQRALYDRALRTARRGGSLGERAKRREDDLRTQSRRILRHLLDGRYEAAIDLHQKMRLRRVSFNLGHHLDERDYLDSLFLLGEAYEDRRQWRTALQFYWEAYERERSGPPKRYFFDELRDRLRVLFSQRLVKGLAPEDALRSYDRALAMCNANRDAAMIYKKIASVHGRLGRRNEAAAALDRAQRLCPGMKGIDAMRRKIAGT